MSSSRPTIRAMPLGAGQDVGRSCIIVSMNGVNVMLDCGMHMGYKDARRFPDFTSFTEKTGNNALGPYIDAVIISHFHLDHCGALPHMTEVVGYNGPIFMTFPTKAIVPILLEDYRKIQVEYLGDRNFFTSHDIKKCMAKCRAVQLHEWVYVNERVKLRACYAGHVLGAAMFQVFIDDQSVLYTGDFNCTPDRHLGAYRLFPQPTPLRPDLLITESTYATTVRDSKRRRESDFLRKIKETLDLGGKVLVPVFALGRAQELFILVERFWERFGLKHPIYFTTGLADKATAYYKLFINWTNETLRDTFTERNAFNFKFIKPYDHSYGENPGPMLVFSTPGMLHGGTSLKIFKMWAPDENNMIIMPGYCVQGTVGYKVINGASEVLIDGQMIPVRLTVAYMSFSAHADAKGIMQLVRRTQPRHVMFVHGEATKMEMLKRKMNVDMPHIPVSMPANGSTAIVQEALDAPVSIPCETAVLEQARRLPFVDDARDKRADDGASGRTRQFNAYLTLDATTREGIMIVSHETMAARAEQETHHVTFTTNVPLRAEFVPAGHSVEECFWRLVDRLNDKLTLLDLPQVGVDLAGDDEDVQDDAEHRPRTMYGRTIVVTLSTANSSITIEWHCDEQPLAEHIVKTVSKIVAAGNIIALDDDDAIMNVGILG